MTFRVFAVVLLVTIPMSAFAQIHTGTKEEAYDAMAMAITLDFVNTMTLGIGGAMLRENGIYISDGKLYWRGKEIDELNDAEKKGANAGGFFGKVLGVVTWVFVLLYLRRRHRKKKRDV